MGRRLGKFDLGIFGIQNLIPISKSSEQYFKAWNTFVKLTYGVPRSTFTYLVEGYFARDFTTLRNQVLGRYPAFFKQLLSSHSKEVRLIANMAARDPKTTTGKNLLYVERLSGLRRNFLSKRCLGLKDGDYGC